MNQYLLFEYWMFIMFSGPPLFVSSATGFHFNANKQPTSNRRNKTKQKKPTTNKSSPALITLSARNVCAAAQRGASRCPFPGHHRHFHYYFWLVVIDQFINWELFCWSEIYATGLLWTENVIISSHRSRSTTINYVCKVVRMRVGASIATGDLREAVCSLGCVSSHIRKTIAKKQLNE